MHRSILLTHYGQDPFDRLSEKFKKNLSLSDIENVEAVMSQDEDDENVDILFKKVGEEDNERINNVYP